MTLALVLLAMLAGGMFWYWQALPKQAPTKKNSRAAEAKRKTPEKKSLPAQAPGPTSTTDKYRAVSIQCRESGCAAARALSEQRFLVKDAPVLPLPDCDKAPCHCSYLHHADQRAADDDRRSVHSLQTELYTRTTEPERRTRRGRRKGDNS
jgi:hypothetical protein